MATKCWFVLAQTHYPPPVLPRAGFGEVSGSGPICLGHLIPDLRHLDNVINRKGPLDIPPEMPIYPTKAWDITRDVNESSDIVFSGKVGVPIATAAGITVGGNASIAFKRTTKNYWEFASLEAFIFQPTREYIEASVEDPEVVAYHKRRATFSTSTLFMITGIIVARGAKNVSSTFQKRNIDGNLSLEIPAIAKAGFGLNSSGKTEVISTTKNTVDFVWAVRLAKITKKGVIDRHWSHETFSKGSTFGLGRRSENAQIIVDILQGEGLKTTLEDGFQMGDDIFVVDEERQCEAP